jgi:hypothetical protein
MTRLFKLFGAVVAMLFVLTPAAVSFAQEQENEAPLIEEPTLWDTAVQTVTEAIQQNNETAGDSQAEQIMDDTNSESGE